VADAVLEIDAAPGAARGRARSLAITTEVLEAESQRLAARHELLSLRIQLWGFLTVLGAMGFTMLFLERLVKLSSGGMSGLWVAAVCGSIAFVGLVVTAVTLPRIRALRRKIIDLDELLGCYLESAVEKGDRERRDE
jgi:hypothetical protein